MHNCYYTAQSKADDKNIVLFFVTCKDIDFWAYDMGTAEGHYKAK